jgi:esterase/lipase superfamily enzyme
MKVASRWHSPRLGQEVGVVRWGEAGLPVLLYPTAGGDAEECERFLMLDALKPLLAAAKIKVYACDSVAGRAWIDQTSTGAHRAWLQRRFLDFVARELVPAIRLDCHDPKVGVIAAGASIGAYNALLSICSHPDLFSHAICMSGTYDLARFMRGEHTEDYHLVSPLHFFPMLPEGPQLELLRTRYVLLATGEGKWEAPWESWRVANMLGSRGVPNRVDLWGPHVNHDWPTWRDMLPKYLDALTRTGKL